MTIKEVETKLSASLNMLKGFCYNGILCDGWCEINENVIEFRYADNKKIIRAHVSEIKNIGKFRIYNEREGYCFSYANVVTK